MVIFTKKEKRIMRHKRVRAKIFGTKEKPRLSVFRSHKHIYGQLINDENGRVILSVSDASLNVKKANEKAEEKAKEEKKDKNLKGKIKLAYEVGETLAKKALEKGIKVVVFDRGGYKYHGRVKSLAEGARAGGLKF